MNHEWMTVYTGGAMSSDPLFHPVLDQYRDLQKREKDLGIRPGTPILVDQDNYIDDRLVRFFSSITWREQSRGTQETYAPIYRPFFSFVSSLGRDPFDIDEEVVGQWKVLRTDFSVNPTGAIQGSTWNKEVAALDLFFTWAANPARGYMPSNPLDDFPTRARLKAGKKVQTSPTERAETGLRFKSKSARAHRSKWLSIATYAVWRDVALLGLQLEKGKGKGKVKSGLPDKTFRGRNKQRNRAWTDLAYMTGLRRQECAALLVCELPPQQTNTVLEFPLGDTTAKNGVGRMILEPSEAALQIHKYLTGERKDAVDAGRTSGRYKQGDWLLVDEIEQGKHGARIRWSESKTWTNVGALPLETRRRLLMETDAGLEPLSLWLTEDGVPTNISTWDAVFSVANNRYADEAKRVGVQPMPVTPHSLRFSFALMLLLALHAAIDAESEDPPGEKYDYQRYDRAYRRTQFQLGHASLSTTRDIYLEAVVEMRDEELLLAASGDIGRAMSQLASTNPHVRADADD